MILLTGASGFIGRHLLSALIKEYGVDNVLALTSAPIDDCKFLLHNNYSFGKDYFISSGYENIETLIHAGSYTPKSSAQANDALATLNIINTSALLDADLPALKKIIFLSTLDVYGEDEIISEQSPVKPASLYGASKVYCETLVEKVAVLKNLKYQILRIGHVYGPGEDAYQKIIPVTIKKILRGEQLEIWGTGTEMRSFIYIADVVAAITNAVNVDPSYNIINVVGAQQITVNDLVHKLLEISNGTSEVIMKPGDKGRDFVFDATRLKKTLLPKEIPLNEGLKLEWEYFKDLNHA